MRRNAAFTLLEVLAVVMLTSIVFAVALNYYVDLSRASERASQHTRDVRRATAILDRLGRDLESTLLLSKPSEVDPLAHPWIFFGESRGSDLGADHLRFVTRGRRPDAGHQSDLEVVAYALREAPDGTGFDLMRWSSPQLPESLERDVPDDEADGALLLAEHLAGFGVTFIDETGARTSSWDSSLLGESSNLPLAVEISVALANPDAPDAEAAHFSRQLVLPVRPLDMEELLDPFSLVSGGTGSAEASDEPDEEVEEDTDDIRVDAECMATPCANRRACAIINCTANLGRHGESTDLMLYETIREQTTFCVWRGSQPMSMRWIIPNPECR